MRLCNPILLCSVALVISAPVTAQQAAPRDPVAISLLQKAVAAMAFTLPADSAASGSVSWTEGSDKEDGTVRVLTRGTDQTAEEIVTSNGGRDVGYSRGQAAERKGERSFSVPMELAFVDQSADFPLPLLAGALSNPDFAFRYLGQETIDGKMALHIRFWNTFASVPGMEPLAAFTRRDIWIDQASGLPRALSYTRRSKGGAAKSDSVRVVYTDYRNIHGVAYPFSILKLLNGTPWISITIQSVSFDTGLTGSDFPLGGSTP